MTIRPAVGDDLAAVADIARAAYAIYVARIGRTPAPMVADFAGHLARGELYVAILDGTIAGYVVFHPRGDHLHLENVAVGPAAQGLGLGKRLVAFVEDEARRSGRAAVELYTNIHMTENLAMYPALGYRETGRRREDDVAGQK